MAAQDIAEVQRCAQGPLQAVGVRQKRIRELIDHAAELAPSEAPSRPCIPWFSSSPVK